MLVFTASLSKYADPLLDLLDPVAVGSPAPAATAPSASGVSPPELADHGCAISSRLFREACVVVRDDAEGPPVYVKDLALLGRGDANTIIVDNSPASYLFQPENALPCE